MSFEFWKRIPTSFALFLFFLSTYAFTMSGWAQYGDEIEKYRVAQSLVEQGNFSFRPTAVRNIAGVGGQTYSIYELGQSVFEIPLYLLGRVFYTFFPTPDPNWITLLFVGLLNPLLSAATCLVLFDTCLRIGLGNRTSLVLTLVYGLGTIAFPYSKGFSREPLLSLLLLLSFYAAYRFRQTNRTGWLLALGVAAGYLVFTKFIQAVAIPIFLGYILVVAWQECRRLGLNSSQIVSALFRGGVLFLLPSLILLGIQSAYALARFGTVYGGIAGTEKNPVEWIAELIGRSQPDAAIGGLLLSPEKSIFLYSPPVILCLMAWFVFLRKSTKEALLLGTLIIAAFLSNVLRPDWDGGTWWGPRYLVQITPFLIIPVGVLLEDPKQNARRVWTWALAVLFAIGIVVQVAAMFRNDRDYMDVTGKGISLVGQLDFLAHGALDSLVLYLSPAGFPIVLNPYGIVLILMAVLFGALMIARMRHAEVTLASPRVGWTWLAIILLVECVAFIVGVVADYPQVLAAQGDTRYVAAGNFLATGRRCEAAGMYLQALDRGTNLEREAIAKLDGLLLHAKGIEISAADLMEQVEMPDDASVAPDRAITVSGNGSLRLSLPNGKDAIIVAASSPLTAQSNSSYLLSGWMKTTGIYGSGRATIALYEDNGNWEQPRTTDIASLDETNGWRPFWGQFTTLATTKRFIVKVNLWETYGTVWVDGLTLGQTHAAAASRITLPCQ